MSIKAIVADIGGTNARFGCIHLDTPTMEKIVTYPIAMFASLLEAIRYYQYEHGIEGISYASIAVACPVGADWVSLTNCPWAFSVKALQEALQLDYCCVLNDFTAIAMSLPVLTDKDLVQIGKGSACKDKPMVVLGPGTGLGVAHLIPRENGYIPLPGEGGHADWAAQDEKEWFIQGYFRKLFGHVSIERLLSGDGLERLYMALADYHQKKVEPLSAAEISSQALSGESDLAASTVDIFFKCLGSFAGNLALTLSTFGGVYIAGGIIPKLLSLLPESSFRQSFESKGRFSSFNQPIPTYVVTAAQPGLLGAGVYLKQSLLTENK